MHREEELGVRVIFIKRLGNEVSDKQGLVDGKCYQLPCYIFSII